MNFWQSLAGMVRLELVSADISGAVAAFANEGIVLQDAVSEDELHLQFSVRRSDAKKVCYLAGKRGEQIILQQKSGIYFSLISLKKRPVLLVGMLLLMFASFFVPSRVFFIRVEGNSAMADRLILEKAAECGVHFGASRRQVRSERMKNALLEAMPQLQWAGVNTKGCTAIITVRERNDLGQPKPQGGVANVVAIRDGIVREMTVLRGNALCHTGQAVKQGQVLISGFTDCGLSILATRAEGEVYGETMRTLTTLMPLQYEKRSQSTASDKNYSLIFGKKRINFFKGSGISGAGCAKIYEENYLTLPGGFVLPVAIITEQSFSYEDTPEILSEAETVLSDFSKAYLPQIMTAGKVLQSNEIFSHLQDVCRLDGSYSCYELLGITRMEENIFSHE